MSRNLKALGLVLVVVFATSAALASAAYAEPKFTATEYPVLETGSQIESEKHVITVKGGTLKCNEVNFQIESGEFGTILYAKPTYVGCTAFGGLNATVNINGCQFGFELLSKIAEDKYSGRVVLLCPKEKAVEITTFGCKVSIPPQFMSSVEYVDDTEAKPAMDETWRTNLAGGEYTQSGACGAGTFKDLKYTGGSTVKGENPVTLKPIGLFISG